ncbi:uncharacterized protein DSM5745_06533 [Aspergillus mulundensis]|uniref:O-methyltransferase C-terminal domain-containing protein n=1 Tax=Aspergillus mulundensis TaxID=1810919 RepID=A0A3D8RRW2_9EURO|nr:hypothetical protein DSM5745_06533 [Aspergillus mulundensis]RDW76541.1 hypothetical protein DSM5745_06533 [Aspergillus mulundensis]
MDGWRLAGSNAAGAVNYMLPGQTGESCRDIRQDTIFQKAFNAPLSVYEWMKQHPEHYGGLFKTLALCSNHDWVDAFPIVDEIGSFMSNDAERVLLVDVGGGTGPQAAIFRQRLPHITGRVIVQDIPETLEHANAIDGIEFMEYDCFSPHPIRGAKFYYLRYVLHLWQDDKCVEALKSIIPAMGPESRILIDELVVPAPGATWQMAWRSIGITATLAGMERTRARWEGVLEAAELEILNIFPYDSNGQAIIVAAPKN